MGREHGSEGEVDECRRGRLGQGLDVTGAHRLGHLFGAHRALVDQVQSLDRILDLHGEGHEHGGELVPHLSVVGVSRRDGCAAHEGLVGKGVQPDQVPAERGGHEGQHDVVDLDVEMLAGGLEVVEGY
jgi:hypothetical protein